MKDFRVLLVYPNLQMINLLPSNISLLSACLMERGFQMDLFDTTFYRIEERSIDEKRVDFLQLRPFDYAEYGIIYKTTDVFSDFRKKVDKYQPDLIAITIVEDTLGLALRLLESVRESGIPVIAGGVHVNLAPDEVIRYRDIDMICYGEGEGALPELCDHLYRGEPVDRIQNIWVRKGVEVVKNPMRPLVDLNAIPYNDFSLFEEKRFFRPKNILYVIRGRLTDEKSRGFFTKYNYRYVETATIKIPFRGCCMNILDCTIVPVEVRNIPAFLPECILSNTNCTNGLLFSSYATASSGFF